MVTPILHPAWERALALLQAMPWAARAGQPLPVSLAAWCASVTTAAEALNLMSGKAWDAWSAERQATVTTFLNRAHPQRYADWNPIARRAKELAEAHRSAITAGLAAAGLTDKVAADTVEWDVIAALTTAAFLDCRPPGDELRLFDVYKAGHLPLGWDAGQQKVLVF